MNNYEVAQIVEIGRAQDVILGSSKLVPLVFLSSIIPLVPREGSSVTSSFRTCAAEEARPAPSKHSGGRCWSFVAAWWC